MIMGVLLGIAVIGDASLQLIYAMVLAICCADSASSRLP